MAYLDEILAVAGSGASEDAKKKAKELDDKISGKISSLDAEINKHQADKLGAIKTRDAAKEKLRKVETSLGVSLDSDNLDESLATVKASKGAKESEVVATKDKEIQALKDEITAGKTASENEKKEYKNQLMGALLEKDVATLLPKYKAKATATEYIIDGIKKKAGFEDGKIVFKNDDGTTMRVNGNDADVEDIVKGMQAKEVEAKSSMFFDIAPEQSGAPSNNGGVVATGDYVPFLQR